MTTQREHDASSASAGRVAAASMPRRSRAPLPQVVDARTDVLRWPGMGRVLRSRWPQFLIRVAALVGLGLAILAGALGTPVGSHNLGIVLVWIAWWSLLILLALPLLGRGWCSICPIPLPGEWLQQGALFVPRPRGFSFNRAWPRRLRNIWLQNIAFSLIAVCSAVVLTQPRVTAVVLISFLAVATGVGMVFQRRAFCRYLCPVGGFIGLYAQLAPVAVRVKDTETCAGHREKSCYRGSADGAGCPWMLFPGTLDKNTYCGMCLECVRTCPHDNIAVIARPFGADLHAPAGRRLDEAFKGFIMLGAAMVYSAVMLGPWGALKEAAYAIGSAQWIAYALGVLGVLYLVLPGAFLASVGLGHLRAGRGHSLRHAFVAYSYALVPLGLMAWIAFSLSFVSASFSYLWPSLSDPFGRGWDLFGTVHLGWQPYFTGILPVVQSVVMLAGLLWSSRVAYHIANEDAAHHVAVQRAAPVIAFCALATVAMLGLLIA